MKRLIVLLTTAILGMGMWACAGDLRVASGGDAAVLDGEFAGWNFGRSPLLEVGWTGGIYNEHRGASLVRFEVGRGGIRHVTGAVLRLYKPRDFWQMRDVTVTVAPVQGAWRPGGGFAEADDAGITWGRAAKLVRMKTIASATAPADRGVWLEFPVPASQVQQWIDRPESNGGLWLDVDRATERGDHCCFYSSRHYLGKGPELVVSGEGGGITPPGEGTRAAFYPLPDEKRTAGWLAKKGRLSAFAKSLAMSSEQAAVFCLFDTDIRKDLIVERYQKPEQDTFRRINTALAGGDEAAVRKGMSEVRKQLLVWEYVRQTCWYTAGVNADVYSGRQLAEFYVDLIYGPMATRKNRTFEETWIAYSPDRMGPHFDKYMADLRERLKLSDAQSAAIAPLMRKYVQAESDWARRFDSEMHRAAALLKDPKTPDAALFGAARSVFFDHEMFLYYQSIYNTPRWDLLIEHAPVMNFARWVVDTRYKPDAE